METCARCGSELGVGRFCLNCGHRIGAPVSASEPPVAFDEARPERPRPSEPPPAERPWDPSADLLPFDEAAPTTTGGLGGRATVVWIIGAVLLVGLVVVLLRVLAVDGADPQRSASDPASGPKPGPADEPADESTSPETVGKTSDLARTATYAVPATAPATTDFDGELVSYVADHLHDGDPSTAWRMPGDASGDVITITLRRPTVVTRVGLVNGYAKQVSGVNWYPNNRRILTARWGFDDGSTLEQTFAERPAVQQVKVPAVLTSTITLTISAVTPPGAGDLGRDYTAISEVAISGRRAR